ncbi:flavoprotein [Actinoplanes sp. NPDC049316]|uniref:flavoprotein n=1 Tax=Actinoplanes sp. NPDC049316 TaxID=3154727 RepID=UPI003436CA62
MSRGSRTLHLVACAAPPCLELADLVSALQPDGWTVHVIATPIAYSWLPVEDVARCTGNPVRHRQRLPNEPRDLPQPDAVLVAPATFNTINKWAAGVNDNLALGTLNESLGNGVPIVASLYAKSALTRHPAFPGSLRLLERAGVHFTAPEVLQPTGPGQPFRWERVVELLRHVTS